MTTETPKPPKFKRLVYGEAMDNNKRQELFRKSVRSEGGSTLAVPLSPEATAALNAIMERDGTTNVRGAKRRTVEAALINEAARRARPTKG